MTIKEAKEKALQMCSRREYCRKDVFDKAVSWGCTPAEAQELVDYLAEQKFVDDRRYTEAFVKDKLRFNKWGRVKIAYMLQMQNIDRCTLMDVLAGIDEDEYCQILTDELKKKYKTIRGVDEYEIKGKLYRFAASRGFEPETINKVIFQIVDMQ